MSVLLFNYIIYNLNIRTHGMYNYNNRENNYRSNNNNNKL